jgi:osmotically-inducible protein OsmY
MDSWISNWFKPTYALIGALMLTSALSGCATYEKCGLGGCPGDAKITANIKAQFEKRPDLQGINDINVQTANHVVYLSGQVSDGLEARIAESIARQTQGVKGVENTISVTK